MRLFYTRLRLNMLDIKFYCSKLKLKTSTPQYKRTTVTKISILTTNSPLVKSLGKSLSRLSQNAKNTIDISFLQGQIPAFFVPSLSSCTKAKSNAKLYSPLLPKKLFVSAQKLKKKYYPGNSFFNFLKEFLR